MSNRKLRVKSLPDLIKHFLGEGYVFEPVPHSGSLLMMSHRDDTKYVNTRIFRLCGQPATDHGQGTITATDPINHLKWTLSEDMCEEV